MLKILVYGFLIFFISSFLGYFIEVFWVFLSTKKIVNRGFLCGPIIPIYGLGAITVLFCLFRYYDDPLVVFVFGVIIASALEYFTSFLLEKIFHNKWWDYSHLKYNLNGRICLVNSLAFGLLALIIVYIAMPLFAIFFSLFPFKVWTFIALFLFIILLIDIIYSVVIAYNLRNRIIIVEELKNNKIALIPIIFEKKLKASITHFKAFPSRLLQAFPYLEHKYHKSFVIMKNYREQLNTKQKEILKKRTRHK